jgi:hypothetical protein
MAVLYTDDNGVKHVSEYDSDSKWKTRIIVDKRKLAIAIGNYDQALDVAAENVTTITVTPSANELWRIKVLRLDIPYPSGATSGNHYIFMGIGYAGSNYSVLQLSSDYNESISINNNVTSASDLMVPFDEISQILAINNIVITNTYPLQIYYNNSTNAAQTGDLKLRIVREVEYIES